MIHNAYQLVIGGQIMAEIDKKDLGTMIGLMVVGGAMLLTEGMGDYAILGVFPLFGGIGYVLYKLKKN